MEARLGVAQADTRGARSWTHSRASVSLAGPGPPAAVRIGAHPAALVAVDSK